MEIRKLFFLSLIVALVMSLSLAIACGDDDDDDDDDDADADDDGGDDDGDSVVQGAMDDCVQFWTDCDMADVAEATCEAWLTGWDDVEGVDSACLEAAFTTYFDCLAGDCSLEGNWIACGTDFATEAAGC